MVDIEPIIDEITAAGKSVGIVDDKDGIRQFLTKEINGDNLIDHLVIGASLGKDRDGLLVYLLTTAKIVKIEIVKRIRARLNGKIHLVLGNHDYANRIFNIKGCFTSFNDIKEIKLDKGRMIVLCHYAMRVWSKSHYNSGQLYGHSHGKLPNLGKQWDVGLDNNGFRLLNDREVIEIMRRLPNNLNMLKDKEVLQW